MTNLEEQKKQYESGDYDCYGQILHGVWEKQSTFKYGNAYKLIHKSHSHIADALIENPELEVESFEGFIIGREPWDLINFFDDYNSCYEYQFKESKQDWNCSQCGLPQTSENACQAREAKGMFCSASCADDADLDLLEPTSKSDVKPNRVEVIGENGRDYSSFLKEGHYDISIQDDGRTIKLFEVKPKGEDGREELEDV